MSTGVRRPGCKWWVAQDYVEQRQRQVADHRHHTKRASEVTRLVRGILRALSTDIAHAATSVSFPLTLGSKATALHAFNMRNELRAGLRTLQPEPHPVTPQGEMALAERARRGMVNDPRPGRLLSPALAPDAMLAPADLEVIAAHLHREPL